ncbi:unnamed protein product [Phyllotreta striolata]|uniref:Protein sleepless n=1 Tax=Phyllotreta striolata TaxID=444603 RepID=A0A9N9XV51_PHYSR|nr:unnamed protein product [Phyllotreta striolata]
MIAPKIIIALLAFCAIINSGKALRCYECIASVFPGDNSPCLNGEEIHLRRVRCIGPSVCAFYRYESTVPGTPPVTHATRGCQSLRYGGTCEDIFNELRARGEVLPGQHTCATCNSDLCNMAVSRTASSVLYFICVVGFLLVYRLR